MADETTTVFHPTLAEWSVEVPADKVEEWAEQGWLKAPGKVQKAKKDSGAS